MDAANKNTANKNTANGTNGAIGRESVAGYPRPARRFARGAAVATVLALVALPAHAQAVEEPAVEEAAAEVEVLSLEALAAALATCESEPSIDDVLTWAREEGLFDPGRADAAMERARLSALLPQLRVGIRRGLGWDALARQSTTVDSSSLSSGEDLSVVGTLVFRLDRLIFASEEPALLRERRSLEEARTALVGQVVALYFERRRILVERALTGVPDVVAELRALEIEALLDALTGLRFGRALHGEPEPVD